MDEQIGPGLRALISSLFIQDEDESLPEPDQDAKLGTEPTNLTT